ncbi:Eco57I restriction-modification methylase domain-containing protein [Streptosporangium sp. LJ11]|uniref:Eco57I restriction-modification methylase domain-containing protein n=1 Tax=Streptosporangium sp. LJ11 TaxID=3436927 RepID=UPI003F79AD6E
MKKFAYLAVKVEGGLIPQDVLSRIGAADRELPGIRPEDYHLAASERLGDAASRRWEYLLGAYRAFRDRVDKLPDGDAATTPTRERWLQVLLGELGFGHVPYVRGGLKAGEKEFPVSHLWHSVPMHLLGWNTELDKGTPGKAATKRVPQSMLQEFLNLSDNHLWGVLSNGRQLRILRDSTTLVGAAYVEFDLEAIFDGELYSDFVLLYTLLHASRFELISGGESVPTCADCWLEKWRVFAAETGLKAREQMRDGVKEALEAIGTGFLIANPKLCDQIESGKLDREEFRHELLRLAYQLIFIFVAEDRSALFDPAAPQAAKDRYTTYFSSRRLRSLAARRSGDRHTDLWKTVTTVIKALGDDEGLPALALPGLGGLFFRAATVTQVLTDEPQPDQLLWCDLPNKALLAGIQKMCTVWDKDGRPRDVDFQHLGAEELGSIYESLLEFVPYVDIATQRFKLKDKISGNERKTTGSYYTPNSLIESLLDTALEPIIEEHAKFGNPDDLLKITVCDPACGSGHFLVAAARRIAKRYAALLTGEDEPVLSAIRAAMHKVVAKCIYGVDIQPLAAELAKISLWIESLEPGKPLAFLDAHIKVGNALLGTTPALLAKGVPDAAFKAIEGDDKTIVGSLKKQNAKELAGQNTLFDDGGKRIGNREFAEKILSLASMQVFRVTDVREQERRFREFDTSESLAQARRTADAWCAAFVWYKNAAAPDAITSSTVRHLSNGGNLPELVDKELAKLAEQYRFFHWHLEFPEIFRVGESGNDINPATGWGGGFSCVLGNPPWEKVKLSEKEFFAARNEEIATAGNKASRDSLIKALATSADGKVLYREFIDAKRRAEGESHYLRASARYPLTATGDVNTYAIFAENNRTVLHPRGRLGVIVPTGIATDATTQYFFKDLVIKKSLASLYDFENARGIFARVHRSYKFSLLTVTGGEGGVDRAEFAFFLHDSTQLADEGKRFELTPEEITLLNPNTGTCPVFRTRRDAEITIGIYRRVPVFIRPTEKSGNQWKVSLMTMFHMSNDSSLFRPSERDGETLESMERDGWQLEGNVLVKGLERLLPLHEGKMGNKFDHRSAEFFGMGDTDLQSVNHFLPQKASMPRYWVSEAVFQERMKRRTFECKTALLGHRRVARSTDERTAIAAILPWSAASYGWIISAGPTAEDLGILGVVYNTFVYDYCLRNALSQPSVPQGTSEQLPIPKPETFFSSSPWQKSLTLQKWILSRFIELTYTGWILEDFAKELEYDGAPFIWDEERRVLLRAELDAAFFHLYEIKRVDVEYIMETFPTVRRKDEAKYGEYRTKELILKIYDSMQVAIDRHQPYQTMIDPPPGNGLRHPENSKLEK